MPLLNPYSLLNILCISVYGNDNINEYGQFRTQLWLVTENLSNEFSPFQIRYSKLEVRPSSLSHQLSFLNRCSFRYDIYCDYPNPVTVDSTDVAKITAYTYPSNAIGKTTYAHRFVPGSAVTYTCQAGLVLPGGTDTTQVKQQVLRQEHGSVTSRPIRK